MIIDKNTNPERDLYYLGGILIDVISSSKSEAFDYLKLYDLFKRRQSITINLYALTLDWLFLLGLIIKEENGTIKKCF